MTKFRMVLLSCVLILLGGFVVSASVGYTYLPWGDLWRAFFRGVDGDPFIIMWAIRLPRIMIAMIVGGALALSGSLLQGISRNALADPGILGINAGAGLGIVVYVLFFHGKLHMTPVYGLPLAAFGGALLSAMAVFRLARRHGQITASRLLLVGIAVGTGISAVMLFFTHRMDAFSYDFIKIWMVGSVWGMNWQYVWVSACWLMLLAPLVYLKANRLNILSTQDELAYGLGVEVQRERLVLLILAAALAGSAVSFAGGIGFVGLIAPHLARRFVGMDYRRLLPVAMLIGAILVMSADTIGRTIVQPIDIPVGIVVAALGGPYFLYQLIRRP